MGKWVKRSEIDARDLAHRLANRTHGLPSTYHAGCREACCREAETARQRRQRRRAAA